MIDYRRCHELHSAHTACEQLVIQCALSLLPASLAPWKIFTTTDMGPLASQSPWQFALILFHGHSFRVPLDK